MSSVVRLAGERTHRLRLYVAGETAGTIRARSQCRRLQDAAASLVIEEIDVLAAPARAEAAGVLATPTLSDETHAPPRRVVGDLSDADRVLGFFGIESRKEDHGAG